MTDTSLNNATPASELWQERKRDTLFAIAPSTKKELQYERANPGSD
jgi:hypothetical protein